MADVSIRGVALHKGLLDKPAQETMLEAIRRVVAKAPLFQPMTPYGKPMSVRMTSAGDLGWYADRTGYRYVEHHPSGVAWPPIPRPVLDVWSQVAPNAPKPECCLINFYQDAARMGMHQDKDEASFDWPVVSISLGDDALFRLGGISRGGKTDSVWLQSGDVVVMGGAARLIYHGIDRTRPGSSTLLAKGGRINLTLRVVR